MTSVPLLSAARLATVSEAQSAEAGRISRAGASGRPGGTSGGAAEGGAFSDVLSMVRRMPGVGMVYRALTGEDLSPVVRVLGGFLTGGVPGAMASAASVAAGEVLSIAAADPVAAGTKASTPTSAASAGLRGRTMADPATPTGGTVDLGSPPADGSGRLGPDLDIARRLQEGLAAYEHSRMLAGGTVPPAPGALLAQAGRVAA